jgi:glycosyltransferase involved in cell wall biosynthesis
MPGTKSVAILGTVGLPANYGGFETLVENLIKYHESSAAADIFTVYCSGPSYPERPPTYLTARLKYLRLQANGVQSIPYDVLSLLSAVRNRTDVILLLGVSGAIALPLIRMFSSARVVTNIDGIEWRREKWRGLAKKFLRLSERVAVRFSDEVISDNAAIAAYVKDTYGVNSHVIAYGGDHAVAVDAASVEEYSLPDKYAFSVCRIEPENNVHIIVEAFSTLNDTALVLVGNWANSDYGRDLRHRYADSPNLYLLDPIYDLGKLKTLRSHAAVYLHGHSAGGTNPSLVEAMHFGVPVLAFDCDFNRSTTEDKALFFSDVKSLQHQIEKLDEATSERIGLDMTEIAQRRYTWDRVAEQYFALLHVKA